MRIGHISDLHILSLNGTKFYHFLNKRIIGGTNLILNRKKEYEIKFVDKLIEDINKQNLDLLVITGDITNLALKSEFKEAVRLLNKINLPNDKIMIVPGNHDNYIKSSYKNNLFEKYMSAWIKNDINLSNDTWPIFKITNEIIITGFSSSVPSCLLCSAGKISKKQLEIFDEVLKNNQNKFKIVLLHHHLPKLSKRKKYMDGLRNRNEFLKHLKKNKIDMVLHGHKHKNSRYDIEFENYKIKVYEAGASARLSKKHPGNWSIYEIKDKKLINIEKRYLDFYQKEFIRKNS